MSLNGLIQSILYFLTSVKDTFRGADTVLNDRITSECELEKMWKLSYFSIRLDGLRKMTKNFSLDYLVSRSRFEFGTLQTGMLPILSRCSV